MWLEHWEYFDRSRKPTCLVLITHVYSAKIKMDIAWEIKCIKALLHLQSASRGGLSVFVPVYTPLASSTHNVVQLLFIYLSVFPLFVLWSKTWRTAGPPTPTATQCHAKQRGRDTTERKERGREQSEGGAWLRRSRAPRCLSSQSGADADSHTNTLPFSVTVTHTHTHHHYSLSLTHTHTAASLSGKRAVRERELEKKASECQREGKERELNWRGTLWIRRDFPRSEWTSG